MLNHNDTPEKRNASINTSTGTLIDRMCQVLEDEGFAYERHKILGDLEYKGKPLSVDIFVPKLKTAIFCKEEWHLCQSGRVDREMNRIGYLKTEYLENMMFCDVLRILYFEDPKLIFDHYLEYLKNTKATERPYFRKARRQWNLHALPLELTNLLTNKPLRKNK
jgi:hypothetical protein